MKQGEQACDTLHVVAISAKYRYAVCTIREFGDPWMLEMSFEDSWRIDGSFENVVSWDIYRLVALVDQVSGEVKRFHQKV